MSGRPDLELAVRLALHYLERVSDDWPVAAREAKRALSAALEVLGATQARELRDGLSAHPESGATPVPSLTSSPTSVGHDVTGQLRSLLTETAERLRGWSEGSGPDDRLRARIEAALAPASRPGAEERSPEPHCCHCGGTGFEGDDPCEFCDGSGRDRWDMAQLEDARAGMAWFNRLTPTQRSWWLRVAESARPADAWQAFQTWEVRR